MLLYVISSGCHSILEVRTAGRKPVTTYKVTVSSEAVHCDCHVFSGDNMICRHIFWLCRQLCSGAEGTAVTMPWKPNYRLLLSSVMLSALLYMCIYVCLCFADASSIDQRADVMNAIIGSKTLWFFNRSPEDWIETDRQALEAVEALQEVVVAVELSLLPAVQPAQVQAPVVVVPHRGLRISLLCNPQTCVADNDLPITRRSTSIAA